jgi:hypothetical protein
MGYSNSNSEQIDYLKLNAKTDESNSPFFTLAVKGADGKWGTDGRFDQVSGYVIGVSRKEGEWQGNPIYSVRVKFVDDQEPTKKFQVEATYNSLTYSILNSLLSLDKSKPVRIRVYSRQSKNDGKFYASAYVESEGNRVDWAIPVNEIPRPEIGMVGKKKVVDDSAVVDFFHTVIDNLTAKFGSTGSPSPAPASEAPNEEQPSQPPAQQPPSENESFKVGAIERARAQASAAQATEPPPLMGGEDDDLPF